MIRKFLYRSVYLVERAEGILGMPKRSEIHRSLVYLLDQTTSTMWIDPA
jgi:hypothetical protein